MCTRIIRNQENVLHKNPLRSLHELKLTLHKLAYLNPRLKPMVDFRVPSKFELVSFVEGLTDESLLQFTTRKDNSY